MLGRHVEDYVSLPVYTFCDVVARCNRIVQHEPRCARTWCSMHTVVACCPDDRAPTLQPSERFEKTAGWDPWGGSREINPVHGSEALVTEKFDKNTGLRGEAEQEVLRPDEVGPERTKAQSER